MLFAKRTIGQLSPTPHKSWPDVYQLFIGREIEGPDSRTSLEIEKDESTLDLSPDGQICREA